MPDKIIQRFDNFFLYEAECDIDSDPPQIIRAKIRVLREEIAEGATMPTYIVKFPDGSTARTSKDMYHITQELADDALRQEILSYKIDQINAVIKARELIGVADTLLKICPVLM